MDVTINGKRIRLDPQMEIGKGGEADIYDIGGGRALKLFKPPDHPDYENLPIEQEGARRRIAEHQRKLRMFPGNLPARVVKPMELAMDRAGRQIVGYTMPLVANATALRRYAERDFRSAGVTVNDIVAIFQDLHATVGSIHRANVVIGDFNDLNVLVQGAEAHCIDADSMQFGSFLTSTFTARFVDPTHCDSKAMSLALARPHEVETDWYAYAVMLFQSLCLVDPYGGVYVPKDPKHRVSHNARPLHRITVFHPNVRYPKPAIPYGVFPDDLLDFFHRTFEKDARVMFPTKLLEFRWTTCTTCGAEHARAVCPQCATAAPAAVRSVTVIRGKVTATRIFRTRGVIVYAVVQNGELKWLTHEAGSVPYSSGGGVGLVPRNSGVSEGGEFRRENGTLVIHGGLDPHIRYRIHGAKTLLAKNGVLVTIAAGESPEQCVVDTLGMLPMFDANASHVYWLEQGRIMRDGALAPERIGDVLQGRTMFWVGDRFGFGFYSAGGLRVGFVFDAERHGLNDSVQLAPMPGHLIDATAVFAGDRCWFFTAMEFGGKTLHLVTVIRADGTVEAMSEAVAGDETWLGRGIRGNAAVGNCLLVPTDDGIVRVEPQTGSLAVTKTFPDTEPFVDAASRIFPGREGLYVVGRNDVTLLKIQ